MQTDSSDALIESPDGSHEESEDESLEHDLLAEELLDDLDDEAPDKESDSAPEFQDSSPRPVKQEAGTPLPNVRVPVTFDIGESLINVRQLESLMAGYTFELSTPVDTPVAVKVFGQLIGHGRLLQIGDRIGVRIMDLQSHGTA